MRAGRGRAGSRGRTVRAGARPPEEPTPSPTEEPTIPPSGGQGGGGSEAEDEEAQTRDALSAHDDVVHAEGSAFLVTDVIVEPAGSSHVRFGRT